MLRFITSIVFIAVMSSTAMQSFAQVATDAAALHAKLKKTIAAAQGFSTNFSVVSGKRTISGNVKAKRGNKFMMNFWERVVVCNGKTVWNYTPQTKSVVIGKYDESQQQTNLETLLFTILQKYAPAKLSRKVLSNGGRYDVLKLLPASAADITSDIASIEIYLKPNTDIIRKLGVTIDRQTVIYDISNLKFLAAVSDSDFEFHPPKGTETVDMR
ncbi:MAG: outer-membrane lipoprotein carrier protein LolA [Bacteroidetes bacterium]|nr:outer membrane lipoprotein carrier protein LolA [Bacteroidota bacterium]MCZ2133021.1 outer-membrane lipoprotein carrier protein LolA [Bacteroidota bacterium]